MNFLLVDGGFKARTAEPVTDSTVDPPPSSSPDSTCKTINQMILENDF